MSRVLVFTGPTLDEETIHEIAPEVEVFPPVSAGDLLRIPLEAGDLVAILDGFYFQAASVRHKEILDLLQRGIHVWGAASMGAMRAAELAPFGMRGFGTIFQAYRSGEIDGDDEVAILHAPEDMDYMKMTEALVNIRYACQAAVSDGLLSPEDSHLIIDTAAALPFFERSYLRIWQKVTEKGLSSSIIDTLRPFVLQKRLDLKRKDALEMVQALQTPPQDPFVCTFELHETALLRDWRIQEHGLFVREQWIADEMLLQAYQVFGEDYAHVHYQLLTAQLTELATQDLNAQRLSDDGTLPESQSKHVELIAQYLSQQYGFSLVDSLPESAQRWLRPSELSLTIAEQLTLLGVRLWHSSSGASWQDSVIKHLRTNAFFPSLVKIVYQTHQVCDKLQEQQGETIMARLFPEKVYAWLMQRWHVSEDEFDIAVLDHGFSSRTECWLATSQFYLYDKYGRNAKSDQLVPTS